MSELETCLSAMIDAARAAGEGLQRHFRSLSDLDVRTKQGPSDLVSIADEEAELMCREMLGAARPDFAFVGEETSASDTAPEGMAWVVDPLDGTTNFLFGCPLWGVNVALVRDGDVVAGVTLIPEMNELYTATLGGGAKLNGRPIRVSARAQIAEALLACGMPFATKPFLREFAREMEFLPAQVTGLRRTGACAVDMAWVASGRWDAYWERYTNAWDMAPGVLIVSEAGGRASGVNGNPIDIFSNNVCVSNGRIHDELIGVLRMASSEEKL
ncbi:MAG: inositol monophosphatase family protein [Henriciella sp.]